MEKTAKKYQNQVEFLFIYGCEAHPEADDRTSSRLPEKAPRLRADNYAERVRVARWLREKTHMTRRILPDEFADNCVFSRYFSGNLDDPVVVVDRDGKIALAMNWAVAAQLDDFLGALLVRGGKWHPGLLAEVNFPVDGQSPPFAAMSPRPTEDSPKRNNEKILPRVPKR